MIVVDTSVLLEILLHTPAGERHADRFWVQERHAPHLVDLEFVNVLRRLVRSGSITSGDAAETLENFQRLAIERHAPNKYLHRIWDLRDAISPYDASYVVLAEALDAPLLTCDAKLSRAHGHRARIELLS